MRKTLLAFALMLAAGGFVFWGLDYARGYVLIVIGRHAVQLSLWLAVLALAILVLA